MLSYEEIIETYGIKVPFVPAIITPRIERPLRNNRYDGGECLALRRILKEGDRVLELGAGIGFLSAVAALIPGVKSVTAVEANPDLIPIIKETHRLNGVKSVDLRNGVVTADDGPETEFYLRADFWASSSEPNSRPFTRIAKLPRLGLKQLMQDVQPTVIVCDVEGGELGLFDDIDLSNVRAVVVGFHPKVYGNDAIPQIIDTLTAKGLPLAEGNREGASVQVFERPGAAAPAQDAAPAALPARSYRDWPISNPRIFVATCMKDEGPFILEWVAWHKSIGVTDLVVFTNDCTDGTDALLDRLQDLGHLTHLPNPALATKDTAFQPIALNYACYMRQFREADFFISMDVDEFINITVGDCSLPALFEKTGPFDVLSMSEVNHGSNQNEHYEPGYVTELFPAHQTTKPGRLKARRGVKSIVRLSERLEKIRNHRPDMRQDVGPILWLDGSGRQQPHFHADRSENGHDARGSFDLARLEHFPLRSLDSYLAKMYRGDVVVMGKQVSRTYWRTRNKHDENSANYAPQIKAAKAWAKKHLDNDKPLMALHDACCQAHAARIKALVQDPVFLERRNWALTEAWGVTDDDE